jgi:hypothetical protein
VSVIGNVFVDPAFPPFLSKIIFVCPQACIVSAKAAEILIAPE